VEVVDAATSSADVTVAEIPAQQLGICRGVQACVVATRAWRRKMGLTTWMAQALILAAPTTDRLDRDPVLERVHTVRHTPVGGS
jgi:hypothetical protein